MDGQVLERARLVAERAAREAGTLARSRFGETMEVRFKDEFGDLLTEVDEQAEAVIVRALSEAFPDHAIRSEESGWNGREGDWLWLVDPLDGTNNYALGLPVFAVALTLIHRQRPALGVIYDPVLDRMYVAERGRGARRDGRPLETVPACKPDRLTVGWIQGHQVQKDSAAIALKSHLDRVCKRVLRLWAPSLLWCMVARGQLDGIVLYNSEGDDLYAGVLMVREAGGAVPDFDGRPFDGMYPEPYLVACHPDQRESMLAIVREGLDGHGGI